MYNSKTLRKRKKGGSAMATVALPGGVVSLTAENTDRLLALGQGDGALLYLALLRHGGELSPARQALGWTQGRLDAAYAALQQAALVGPAPAQAGQTEDLQPPEYGTQDVVEALTQNAAFSSLQRQVEQELGRTLTPADLKTLYTIYDYLALPPEVIYLLTAWCVEETERKYGPGRRPRMSVVKKEALRWHDRGVDTLPAAEEYLQGQKSLAARERELLPLVGIQGRPPLDKEREYLATWVDWGFSDEAITLAYERTLLKKQAMSWPYMNSILKSWHAKGLHTPAQIRDGDAAPRRQSGPGRPGAPKDSPELAEKKRERMARNIAALKRAAGESR